MPTSAIKDLLKKWEAVRAMVLEWHPNQADVSRSDRPHVRALFGDRRRYTFYTDFIRKDMDATVKGASHTLVMEFKSVKRIQRRVRTERNVETPRSKYIHQWERTLKETGTLVSQTGKYLSFCNRRHCDVPPLGSTSLEVSV
ncbi:hypothetical protein TNCV_783391 [Trichonephila clavipes]|nr:hypothetical protein TNCV_783391 [Trichonephila clavipes]